MYATSLGKLKCFWSAGALKGLHGEDNLRHFAVVGAKREGGEAGGLEGWRAAAFVVAKRDDPCRDRRCDTEKPAARVVAQRTVPAIAVAKRDAPCPDRRCETDRPHLPRRETARPCHHSRCETETRNNFSANLGDRQIQIVNLFLTRFISR